MAISSRDPSASLHHGWAREEAAPCPPVRCPALPAALLSCVFVCLWVTFFQEAARVQERTSTCLGCTVHSSRVFLVEQGQQQRLCLVSLMAASQNVRGDMADAGPEGLLTCVTHRTCHGASLSQRWRGPATHKPAHTRAQDEEAFCASPQGEKRRTRRVCREPRGHSAPMEMLVCNNGR